MKRLLTIICFVLIFPSVSLAGTSFLSDSLTLRFTFGESRVVFLGQVLLSDGTVSFPGISFGTEPSLGFFRLAPGIVGVSPSLERHVDLEIGAATQGPTSPSSVTEGTMRGLSFSTDAHSVFFNFDIPRDWDEASNMTLEIHWFPTAVDILLAGETVKWDANYRVIAEGVAVDAGIVTMSTITYTQSGAGTDKQDIKSIITLNFADANQPLVFRSTIFIQLDRDVTADTYSGGAIVPRVDLIYTANKLAQD